MKISFLKFLKYFRFSFVPQNSFIKSTHSLFLDLTFYWFSNWFFSSGIFKDIVNLVLFFKYRKFFQFIFNFSLSFLCIFYEFIYIFNWLYTFDTTDIRSHPRGKFLCLYNTNTKDICAVCVQFQNTVFALCFLGMSVNSFLFKLFVNL